MKGLPRKGSIAMKRADREHDVSRTTQVDLLLGVAADKAGVGVVTVEPLRDVDHLLRVIDADVVIVASPQVFGRGTDATGDLHNASDLAFLEQIPTHRGVQLVLPRNAAGRRRILAGVLPGDAVEERPIIGFHLRTDLACEVVAHAPGSETLPPGVTRL